MPSGAGGLPGYMQNAPPPPPGYSAGTGSSDNEQTGTGPTHNVFNHDPKRKHTDNHSPLSGEPKPKWLPPFRLGTSDPGVDVKDARDLINARGSKKAAAANKSFEKSPYKAHPAGRRPGGPGDTTAALGGVGLAQAIDGAADGRNVETTAASKATADAFAATQGVSIDGVDYPAGSPQALAAGGGGNTSGVSDARDSQITGSAAPINHPSDAADSHAKRRPLKQSQNPKNADLGPAAHPHNKSERLTNGIDFAESEMKSATQSWKRRCQEFTRKFVGLEPFQENTPGHNASAYNAWQENITGKHEGDRNPPIGVPVYWKGGHPHDGDPNGDGHAAISAGNGMIYSNDIGESGKISKVPLSRIEEKWGFEYLGWGEVMNGTRIYDPDGGDEAQGKGIDSSTTSGHRNSYHAPVASNMPTSGALPAGVGSGHDTHPWAIIPKGKRFEKGPRSAAAGRGYTQRQLREAWIKAGGDPDVADQAAAVAYYESDGGNPNAINANSDSHHSVDKGLFQINTYWNPKDATYDVEQNLKAAVKLSNNGQDWSQWTNPVSEALQREAGKWRKGDRHYDGYVPGKSWDQYHPIGDE